MSKYPELKYAREQMSLQNELYRPTSFWDEASQLIVDEIEANGIETFRSLSTILDYFVPTYGVPGNAYTPEIVESILANFNAVSDGNPKLLQSLKDYLSGRSNALSDYRVLLAADEPAKLPYLHLFSESNSGTPVEHFEFDGRKFSRSSLNYLLGLAMLKKHLKGEVPSTILEIGGGYGSLGEVLASAGIKDLKYIDIDIPPTSFVAEYYLKQVLGGDNVATYEKTRELESINIQSLPKASVFCSWQIEKIQGEVDLFVNFISFQEMEPHIVKNYLSHVSRLKTKWVLLRNIREGKQIKTAHHGGVETPILSDDYKTMLPEYELVEGNVIPFGYRTTDNFHSELLLLKRI
jgi:putative sugar O-methyltransferase